jgi:hypothetical protein
VTPGASPTVLNAGVYRLVTVVGDSDLEPSNIKSGVTIFGVTGTDQSSTANTVSPCENDGQVDCVIANSGGFKAANISGISAWDLRAGKTLAGIEGKIRFYRNMANTALYDRTTGAGALTGLDIYDTQVDGICDWVNSEQYAIIENACTQMPFPLENPWTDDMIPPGSNWTEVLGPCNGSGTCIVQDEITRQMWAKSDGAPRAWEEAISNCEELTYGGYTDWWLPSMKELMQAYIDGIWIKKNSLGLSTNDPAGAWHYWTSTASWPGPYPESADWKRIMDLAIGSPDYGSRYWHYKNICVRYNFRSDRAIKMVISSPSGSVAASECSAPFTVSFVDIDDHLANVLTRETLTLSGAGTGAFYKDNDCTQDISQLDILAGNSGASFYYKASTPQYIDITVSALGVPPAVKPITVSEGIPAKIALTGPAGVDPGECSEPIRVAVQNNSNLPAVLNAATTILLSRSGSSGVFFSDSSCAQAINSVSIPAGVGYVFVRYKDTVSRVASLTASVPGLVSGGLDLTVHQNYSCQSLYNSGVTASGTYTIFIGDNSQTVYCDMADGGGWTLIAASNGGSTPLAQSLPAETSYGVLAQSILVPLAQRAKTVRLLVPSQSINVKSISSVPIERLRSYYNLNYDQNKFYPEALWSPVYSNMSYSCDTGNVALSTKIYHACGNPGGFHWNPSDGSATWSLNGLVNENLTLWIR